MEKAQPAQEEKGVVARFLAWMIKNKPDLLFAIIRNTRPNLVTPGKGPVFVTRFRDVQEALERPEIFNVTYAPMIDPSVGPFMIRCGVDLVEASRPEPGSQEGPEGRMVLQHKG